MNLAQDEVPELYEKYASCGQQHVLGYWHTLTKNEKNSFKEQLEGYDPCQLNGYFEEAKVALEKVGSNEQILEPFPEDKIESIEGNSETAMRKTREWNEKGLDMIAEGKLATILLAGGQGTRLGSNLPKGCYKVGLRSGKSLFHIQAERISRVERLASERSGKESCVPWYVMTSASTHDKTVEHFEDNNYFGLDKRRVKFFKQDQIPAFDYCGKLLMDTKCSLSLSPNGNGGVYESMRTSGVLKELKDRKIEYVHIYCVDNMLCRVADPVLLGYAGDFNADVVAKAVMKRHPHESAGVFCLKRGVPGVAEYSEIPSDRAEALSESGKLVYYAANIANHLLSVEFLERIMSSISTSLPYHPSNKKIKHIDSSGSLVSPKTPNGIKLEKFLFDVFSLGNNFRILMVDRNDEFVPLKNAPGADEDTPEVCLEMFVRQSVRFATSAGARLLSNQDSKYPYLELSPLLTFRGEGLEWLDGKSIACPVYVSHKEQDLSAPGV